MQYDYKCDAGHFTEIKKCITDDIPAIIYCAECGKTAYRDWAGSTIQIPDHMKSGGVANADNGANLSYIRDRMKNFPSGKRKIYY